MSDSPLMNAIRAAKKSAKPEKKGHGMSGHISSIGDHHSDPAKAQVTIQHGASKKGKYPDSTHLTVSKEHAASLRLGQKVAVGIMPAPNC